MLHRYPWHFLVLLLGSHLQVRAAIIRSALGVSTAFCNRQGIRFQQNVTTTQRKCLLSHDFWLVAVGFLFKDVWRCSLSSRNVPPVHWRSNTNAMSCTLQNPKSPVFRNKSPSSYSRIAANSALDHCSETATRSPIGTFSTSRQPASQPASQPEARNYKTFNLVHIVVTGDFPHLFPSR